MTLTDYYRSRFRFEFFAFIYIQIDSNGVFSPTPSPICELFYSIQYICILIVFKYNKIILTHSLMAFGTFHNIFIHSDGILEFIS